MPAGFLPSLGVMVPIEKVSVTSGVWGEPEEGFGAYIGLGFHWPLIRPIAETYRVRKIQCSLQNFPYRCNATDARLRWTRLPSP